MKNKQQAVPDPGLDAPSVANEQKHINFLKEEEDAGAGFHIDTDPDDDIRRQQQWQEQIQEGKRANNDGSSALDPERE